MNDNKEKERKAIKKFMKEHPESVQYLSPATQAAAYVPQLLNPESGATELVPHTFQAFRSKMSGIDCYTVIMSFAQIRDYLVYAEEIYSTDTDVTERWQRGVSNPRIRDVGKYLTDHAITYFPPLICVPVGANFLDDSTVEVRDGGLAVLDGQHRRGGIIAAIEQKPELSSNTIPVCILNIDNDNGQGTGILQQIFADVNRTPRKVSKALNLVFDHNDREGSLATNIAKTMMLGLIDTERLSPKRSSGHIASLTNLYNLIRPMSQYRDEANGYFLSEDEIASIVFLVVDNLPGVRLVRTGQRTFGEMRQEYVCYYSTVWQALGLALGDVIKMKTPEDVRRFADGEAFVDFVKRLMNEFVRVSVYDITDKRWQHPDRLVVAGPDSEGNYKVGTQKDHVVAAKSILMDFVTTVMEKNE